MTNQAVENNNSSPGAEPRGRLGPNEFTGALASFGDAESILGGCEEAR